MSCLENSDKTAIGMTTTATATVITSIATTRTITPAIVVTTAVAASFL
jgi:hypothetical protein